MSSPVPENPAQPVRRRAWWGDRGVKVKVLAAVTVTAVVAAVIGVLGLTGMSTAADDAGRLYADNMQGAMHAAALEADLGNMRTVARDALIAATPADTTAKFDQLD